MSRRHDPNASLPPDRPRGPSTDGARAAGGLGVGENGTTVAPTPLVAKLERKRRMVDRLAGRPTRGAGEDGAAEATPPAGAATVARGVPRRPAPPDEFVAEATWASFVIDGIDVGRDEVLEALAPNGTNRPALRAPQARRLRNHAAILRQIEGALRQGAALSADDVMRWYTGVGAGLPMTALDPAAAARLDEVVRRANSPQLRLRAAVREVAAAYVRLLADPVVPSFNGILARLLLHYHLGRCGLPGVVFEPTVDGGTRSAAEWAGRLVELLEESYERLLGRGRS
jgi:hypothetical protein